MEKMPSLYCKASNEKVYAANGNKFALNLGWSLSLLESILFILYIIQNMQFNFKICFFERPASTIKGKEVPETCTCT